MALFRKNNKYVPPLELFLREDSSENTSLIILRSTFNDSDSRATWVIPTEEF
jgi:hypothetical protein